MPIVVIVVIPGALLLWLLFASLYYIFWGAELKRRAKIEEQFRKMKKL
jgi:hypothetical protein